MQSLRELCIEVLIDNKHALGALSFVLKFTESTRHVLMLEDVGDVPSAQLIPVLSHCTPEELQKIEDKTWSDCSFLWKG